MIREYGIAIATRLYAPASQKACPDEGLPPLGLS